MRISARGNWGMECQRPKVATMSTQWCEMVGCQREEIHSFITPVCFTCISLIFLSVIYRIPLTVTLVIHVDHHFLPAIPSQLHLKPPSFLRFPVPSLWPNPLIKPLWTRTLSLWHRRVGFRLPSLQLPYFPALPLIRLLNLELSLPCCPKLIFLTPHHLRGPRFLLSPRLPLWVTSPSAQPPERQVNKRSQAASAVVGVFSYLKKKKKNVKTCGKTFQKKQVRACFFLKGKKHLKDLSIGSQRQQDLGQAFGSF